MALTSQGIEAAKSQFKNGDIKMFVLELLSLGYQSYLCSSHLSTIIKYVNCVTTVHLLLIVIGKCQARYMTLPRWTLNRCGAAIR